MRHSPFAHSRAVVAAGALLAASLLVPASAFAQKLVIVARHAERADGGSMAGGGAQTDPPLSAAGEARAQKLAAMLADAGVTAIVTTEFKRTQDTAKPLAATRGLTPMTMPARDTAGLVAMLKSSHAQGVVLVVGHSNTVPAIIKALGGGDVTVPDTDYDSLFIVVPATGTVTRIRY